MKKLFKFKYKLYRRYKSDIWGLIILKNKKDNLFNFILDNFKKSVYSYHYFSKKFKLRFLLNDFYKNYDLKKQKFYLKEILKKKLFNINNINIMKLNINKNELLIKYLYRLFWLKFFNLYNLFITNNNILQNNKYLLFVNKRNFFSNIFYYYYLYWYRKPFALKKNKIFSRFIFNNNVNLKRNKFNYFSLHDHLSRDYLSKVEVKVYYNKLKNLDKKSSWWEIKLKQEKVNIFFGFFNKNKFIKFQEYCFFSNKLRFCWLLKLIGRLGFIIFTFNFYNDMYYIYNFIRKGNVMVNNKVIIYPDFQVKLFDNISIIRSQFKKIYCLLKFRLKKKNIFFNVPGYIEINYKILTGSIFRYPLEKEIFGPYEFPFRIFSFDWLSYKKFYN